VSYVQNNTRRVVRIEQVVRETPTVTSILFRDSLCARASPGQFVMVWLLGYEEVPMSLAFINEEGLSGITVREVGDTTRAMRQLRVGDRIVIRGPFGRGFSLRSKKPLIVGGGTGIAPLRPLIRRFVTRRTRCTVVLGGASSQELIYHRWLQQLNRRRAVRYVACTEDGSVGVKGTVVDALRDMDLKNFDYLYVCGPEKMIAAVADLAQEAGVPGEASVERYIKCGVGICGSCQLGWLRVCRDGPVVPLRILRRVNEFARIRRDDVGRPIPVE